MAFEHRSAAKADPTRGNVRSANHFKFSEHRGQCWGSSLFGVLRSCAFELSAASASDVFFFAGPRFSASSEGFLGRQATYGDVQSQRGVADTRIRSGQIRSRGWAISSRRRAFMASAPRSIGLRMRASRHARGCQTWLWRERRENEFRTLSGTLRTRPGLMVPLDPLAFYFSRRRHIGGSRFASLLSTQPDDRRKSARLYDRAGWRLRPVGRVRDQRVGVETTGTGFGAARRGMIAMTTNTAVMTANVIVSGLETKIARSPSEIASAWRSERSNTPPRT